MKRLVTKKQKLNKVIEKDFEHNLNLYKDLDLKKIKKPRKEGNVKGQTSNEWTNIGTVKGNGTINTPSDYTFSDKGLQKGKYNYRLKQIDFNGNFEYFNLSGEVSVGIPTVYRLSQNYPNPFNPVTKIDYDLPYDGRVSILLYDLLGREIANLVNEVKEAGYYTLNFNSSNLSSGVYFYKIMAAGNGGQKFEAIKKMMVVK